MQDRHIRQQSDEHREGRTVAVGLNKPTFADIPWDCVTLWQLQFAECNTAVWLLSEKGHK